MSRMRSGEFDKSRIPIFGILSVAMTPAGVLFTQLGGWIIETLVEKPGSISITTLLPGVVRASANVQLACLAQGVVAGFIALLIGERPRWLPVLALSATALLLISLLAFAQ